jgi:hypothetical protein
VGQVYRMDADRKTLPLKRFDCRNEDKDLQQLLQNNLDLLPGDQIKVDQEQDLRWLLIKREMPAINAASGEQGLYIDFLLADQYGIPTIVECKRHADGRTRREVIAQVLEYAACGHYYWEESELLSHAENSAGGDEKLKDKLGKLIGTETSPQEFFHTVKENLKSSKIRCIFFLEDSPLELRNLVEFLNAQMTDIDLLIVEARQYELLPEGERIVVPWVFGYSEKARAAKRKSKAETVRASAVKGEDAFWEAAERISTGTEEGWAEQLKETIASIEKIPGCKLTWVVSCSVSIPVVVPGRILVGFQRDGGLLLYLDRWIPQSGTELTREQLDARDAFLTGIEALYNIPPDELRTKMTWRVIGRNKWLPRAGELLSLIGNIASFAPAED